MPFLFSFAGGSGHFEPLLPLDRAAGTAGHTVAFAGQLAMVSVVEAAGLPALATGGDTLTSTAKRLPLLKLDPEREERDLREGFAGQFARERANAILDLCAAWQPDLLVGDEMDFGALIAAKRLGLPYATVLVIAVGSFVRPEVVATPLNKLRAEIKPSQYFQELREHLEDGVEPDDMLEVMQTHYSLLTNMSGNT
jgi:UDP:flavonoid glycosyltransferase YjiC (YdhE family)